jgi:hypothetical protein
LTKERAALKVSRQLLHQLSSIILAYSSTMATKSSYSQAEFQVCDLPPEVRRMIWKLFLTSEAAAFVLNMALAEKEGRWQRFDSHAFSAEGPSLDVPLTSGLLRASRSIYAETRPILYGGNTFMAFSAEELDDFEQVIGEQNSSLIKRVCAEYYFVRDSRGLRDRLASWKGLSLLRLVWFFTEEENGASSIEIYRDVTSSDEPIFYLSNKALRSEIAAAINQFPKRESPAMDTEQVIRSPYLSPFPVWRTVFPNVSIRITLHLQQDVKDASRDIDDQFVVERRVSNGFSQGWTLLTILSRLNRSTSEISSSMQQFF